MMEQMGIRRRGRQLLEPQLLLSEDPVIKSERRVSEWMVAAWTWMDMRMREAG